MLARLALCHQLVEPLLRRLLPLLPLLLPLLIAVSRLRPHLGPPSLLLLGLLLPAAPRRPRRRAALPRRGLAVQLRQQGLLPCEGLHLRRTAQHRAQRRRHRRAQVGAAPRQLLW